MIESAILRATFASAVYYMEEEVVSLQGKILQYNFVNDLLKQFKAFNRKVDALLNSFSPPELPEDLEN